MRYGLLEVLNNSEIEAREEAAAHDTDSASYDQHANLLCRLESYVESCWQAAKTAKEAGAEIEMLNALRQREGVYSPSKLAEIKEQGGSEIYMMLTNFKCRAAEGWIRDILFPQGERPFTVKPSPVPDDLPEELKQGVFQRTMAELQAALDQGIYPTQQQVYERARALYDQQQAKLKEEATLRAQRMEDAVDDQLVEGCWYDAMSEMISDLVTHPAAFIKGPVMQRKAKLIYETDPETGRSIPRASDELTPVYYSPSPFDMYPAPDSRAINDGYLIEKMSLRRSAIYRMIGVPGYNEAKIRAALDEYQRGLALPTAVEQERRDLEGSPNYQMTPDHSIDAIEFRGSARGEWLLEWGMSPKEVPDRDAEYEITALKIGRFTVRCILNEDPLGRRPYDKASWDEVKGKFWGNNLPSSIRDIEAICNACARALCNNMGIASGPLVEVEVDRLAEGEDLTQLYPWRMFQTKASKTTPAPAVRFHNVQAIIEPLMRVYSYFSNLADHYSGIPSYEQGVNQTSGAAATASGLSMLMTASSRLVKRVIAGVDRMIVGSVSRTTTSIMLHGNNPDVYGDANVVARGASSLIAKEQQQVRRTQFMQATANPVDMQVIGLPGRAEMLREAMRSLEMDPDIIPSKDELQRQLKIAQAQAQVPQLPPPGGTSAGPTTLDAAGNPAGGVEHRLF
jgi:hypothetical protein